MDSVEGFLAHAIKLEEEAVLRFGQLADAMVTGGNIEVSKLFRRLSDYSRLHLGVARSRAGFRDVPEMNPGDYDWPGIESPEAASISAADPLTGPEQALEVALECEMAGLAYYQSILDSTKDPEVKALAEEFVEEESQHVAELERWIGLQAAQGRNQK
ncbi:MAG TPA: ferritin family protein [Acidiferrobacter sp.]|nr:ferritin family protein [Acidiferrobacter sp.]